MQEYRRFATKAAEIVGPGRRFAVNWDGMITRNDDGKDYGKLWVNIELCPVCEETLGDEILADETFVKVRCLACGAEEEQEKDAAEAAALGIAL
jgi:hypothetical protein